MEQNEILFCPYCGTKLDPGARFCKNCGETIQQVKQSLSEPEHRSDDRQSGNPNQRKTVYEGYIHRCPNCGEVLKSFVAVCPVCGHELRDNSAARSIKFLHSNITSAKTESEKIEIVKTFPIPTSKEDIYEFMILASSNFDENYYVTHKDEEDISDAWLAKIEQCYQKAKISFSDEKEFQRISEIYASVQQRIEKATKDNRINVLLPIACISVGLILMMVGQEFVFVETLGLISLGLGIAVLCKRRKKDSKEIPITTTTPTNPEYTQKRKGFSSWGTGAKVLWILLNMYTIGIPAIIYACRHKKK